jgi:hypothetical protein
MQFLGSLSFLPMVSAVVLKVKTDSQEVAVGGAACSVYRKTVGFDNFS